jgi:membrane associated rhomboid family serine protease
VLRLIIANVALFGLQTVQPGLTNWFVFAPRFAFSQPWTWLTYMFIHGGLAHLFWNMLALFIFGPRVESRMGGTQFIRMYLVAGLTGALLTLVMAPQAGVLGASGAVNGVMMCYAIFWPRDRILIWGVIPVEAWLLVTIFAIWSVMSGLNGSTGGIADFAHLGGYLGAYVFMWAHDRRSPARRFRQKVASVAPETEKALKANWRNVRLDGVHQLSRDEVNRILDKIGAQGIGSLTPDEKRFLSNFVPPDDRKNWTQ